MIQQELLTLLRDHPKATPEELAVCLGVPEREAIYWLTALAREGLVRILGLEVAEKASYADRNPR